jgi:pyocin large subunit-like protein
VACGTRVRIEPAGVRVTVTEGKAPAINHAVTLIGLQPGTRYTVMLGTAKFWLATNVFTATGSARLGDAAQELSPSQGHEADRQTKAPPAHKTWGNYATLPDHFARHGADFHAKDQEDYARMAWEFLQRAKADGLPAKLDEQRVLRVFDPKTGAFAAYNHNGTTRTFFKPGSHDYFDRQPGRTVDLKTWRSN